MPEDKWISIKDRLPKEEQRVIYWFKETGVARGRFTQCAFPGEKMDTFYGDDGWLSDDVTHWMPDEGGELPEEAEGGEVMPSDTVTQP